MEKYNKIIMLYELTSEGIIDKEQVDDFINSKIQKLEKEIDDLKCILETYKTLETKKRGK